VNLAELVLRAADTRPDAEAMITGDERITYGALDELATQAANVLRRLGVRAGDRVGVYAPKGPRTLACMQGALRAGAAYVPIDPASPPARAAAAFAACGASAIVAPAARLREFRAERATASLGWRGISVCDESGADACWRDVTLESTARVGSLVSDDELAFVLYTSGSTGASKGVCISHRNALSFVQWAVDALQAGPDDRFANHAPYNFDLSVFDLYGAFLAGARVVTVPHDSAYLADRLVGLCRAREVSIWYSVPTALTLMLQRDDFTSATVPSLRAIVFAGEVFPIRGVRALRRAFPHARLFNFYGPTETNVCTAYEVHDVSDDRITPVPIGSAACGDRIIVTTADGRAARVGEEGELAVEGPTVAIGYWNAPFPPDTPYRTGDLVRVVGNGLFEFVGRIDRMVKLRGWRVEPAEIEAALVSHAAIEDAAVAVLGEGADARIVGYLVARPRRPRPSLLDVKRHCAARLPPYMNVAEVRWLAAMPRTPNGKIDYARLRAIGGGRDRPSSTPELLDQSHTQGARDGVQPT
jgi:amino acid adenylation domain-containing protein